MNMACSRIPGAIRWAIA